MPRNIRRETGRDQEEFEGLVQVTPNGGMGRRSSRENFMPQHAMNASCIAMLTVANTERQFFEVLKAVSAMPDAVCNCARVCCSQPPEASLSRFLGSMQGLPRVVAGLSGVTPPALPGFLSGAALEPGRAAGGGT